MTREDKIHLLKNLASGKRSIDELNVDLFVIDYENCTFEQLEMIIRLHAKAGKQFTSDHPALTEEDRSFVKALPMKERPPEGAKNQISLDRFSIDQLRFLVDLDKQLTEGKQ